MLNCSVFPPQLWKIYLPPFAFDPAWTSWTLQVLKSCWLYFVFLLLIAAAYLHFTQKCLRHKIHFKVKVNKNGRFQAAFAIMWCEGQWRFLLEGVMINVNKLRNCQIAVVSFFFPGSGLLWSFVSPLSGIFFFYVVFSGVCCQFRNENANPTLAGHWVGALCDPVFFFAVALSQQAHGLLYWPFILFFL